MAAATVLLSINAHAQPGDRQDPNAVQEVLDDVLIDRRGGRRGFPPPVQQELLRLRAFNLGRRSGQSGRLPVSRAVR